MLVARLLSIMRWILIVVLCYDDGELVPDQGPRHCGYSKVVSWIAFFWCGMVRSHGKTKENKRGCPGIGLAPVEPVFAGTVVGAGPPPPSDSSPGQAGPAGPTSEALGVVVVLE